MLEVKLFRPQLLLKPGAFQQAHAVLTGEGAAEAEGGCDDLVRRDVQSRIRAATLH